MRTETQKREGRRRTSEPGREEYTRAVDLLGRGEHDRALELLEAALRANPCHPAIHEARGRALLSLGRGEEALGAFRSGNALTEDCSEDCWLGEARALTHLHRYEEARTALLAAVRLCEATGPDDEGAAIVRGNHADALIMLGLDHMRREEYNPAYIQFLGALELDPEYGLALFHTGQAAFYLGQLEVAAPFLRTAVDKLDEEQGLRAHALYLLGHTYYRLGDMKWARVYLKEAADGDHHAEYHVLLALTLERLGEHGDAVGRLGRALALDPAHAWARDEMRRLLGVSAAKEAGETGAAEDWRADTFWPEVIGAGAGEG